MSVEGIGGKKITDVCMGLARLHHPCWLDIILFIHAPAIA